MKPKDLIKLLEKNGWRIKRIQGSHHILENSTGEKVTIPLHNTDMKPGLLNKLLKQTGLK